MGYDPFVTGVSSGGRERGPAGMLRFATIGTSGIAEQFLLALADVGEADYVAAYSRDLARAREFGAPFGARLFFDDVDDLVGCDEVDAVYIASPNALHAEQALAAIRRGKHVLVEKPFAANEAEARLVFDEARRAGVVALEATRSLHVPAFSTIERIVTEELGQVRLATFRFSKVTSRIARLRAGERINVFDPTLSGGALMDIGVYCVEPAVALFGRPEKVHALAVTSLAAGATADDPCGLIDLAGEALLGYGDKIVCLSYGKLTDDIVSSQVEGERGTLAWDQVSCPANLRVHTHEDRGMVFRMEGASVTPVQSELPERDMVCEISDFVLAVRGEGEALAARERFEAVTVDSLSVMDEIRRQAGVRFPADAR